MATTHVLIVDETTFKVHLEYLFAGTGSRTDAVDFNNSLTTSMHYSSENKLWKAFLKEEKLSLWING